jgi:deazaflavin-dependent oxidoreductase (nitroreductase family)
MGRFVLLLTTTGRKSGKPRVTALMYEERDGVILIASARGPAADWLHNIQANPNVQVWVGRRQFAARAELVTDAGKIADYLGRQLAQNPGMFGRIMQMEGLSRSPSRAELESVASRRPMVVLRANPSPSP